MSVCIKIDKLTKEYNQPPWLEPTWNEAEKSYLSF